MLYNYGMITVITKTEKSYVLQERPGTYKSSKGCTFEIKLGDSIKSAVSVHYPEHYNYEARIQVTDHGPLAEESARLLQDAITLGLLRAVQYRQDFIDANNEGK